MYALTNYFNKGTARSIRAKKNIIASFIIKGTSLIITLAFVPLALSYLNPTKYGIWLTLSSITAWFAFLDIGLGNGLRNKFAEALAKNDIERAKKFISTTYAIVIVIILTIYFMFLLINPWLDWSVLLNTDHALKTELTNIAFIQVSFFLLGLATQLIYSILMADQKSAICYGIGVAGNLITLIIVYLLVQFNQQGSLLYLACAASFSPVIATLLATIYFFKQDYKTYRPSFILIDYKSIHELSRLGVQFCIIQISAVIILATDNVIIAQLFDPSAVTSYNIAFKYLANALMVFGLILTPLWSAYTEAYEKKDIIWIKQTINKMLKIWLLFVIFVVFMVIFSNRFYILWVGKSINVSIWLSIFLGMYVILCMWNQIFSNFMNGIGKIRLQMYTFAFISITNIPLAILLAKYCHFGPPGVILASLICISINSLLLPAQYSKLVDGKARGIWSK